MFIYCSSYACREVRYITVVKMGYLGRVGNMECVGGRLCTGFCTEGGRGKIGDFATPPLILEKMFSKLVRKGGGYRTSPNMS